MDKIKFNSLAELQSAAYGLDRAEERDVYTVQQGYQTGGKKAHNYKAIWNTDKNHLSSITSRMYKIIQHKEIFAQVISKVGSLGVSVFGSLKNYGDYVSLEFSFKDKLTEVGNEQLNIGIRFINSYNKNSSFKGEMFAFRRFCQNGMFLGKVFSGVSMSYRHVGARIDNGELHKAIDLLISQIVSKSTALSALVSDSLQDTYEWELAQKYLDKAIHIKKWRELIFARIENKKNPTRWELYNAITAVATHSQSLTAATEQYLQNKAQQVLISPLKIEVETPLNAAQNRL